MSTPEAPAAAAPTGEPPVVEAPDAGPRFSRAILALTAAATLSVAPVATAVVAPAGSGSSAHSSPVYVMAQAAHDIGHNDWAFQGGLAGRIVWAGAYVTVALFWLSVGLWIRRRVKRAGLGKSDSRSRLWIKVLIAAWATEGVAGSLTLSIGWYTYWSSPTLGPALLRFSDLCSPWLSFAAVLLVVGLAEHRALAIRAAAVYGLLLAVILLVPLPGPDVIKVLVLAAAAAVPALWSTGTAPTSPVTPSAAASG